MTSTKSNKLIPPSLKVIIIPLFYLIILAVISVVAFRLGVSRINQQRKELNSAKKSENVLIDKEQELKNTASLLGPLVTPSTMALPNTNPALMVISNMKTLMVDRQIAFEDLKLSGGQTGDTGISKLGVTFTIEGNFDETLSFLKDTKNVAPLIIVNRMQVSASNEITNIDVGASSNSSPYPDKLPAVTEPIDKITDEEFDLLEEMTEKTPPAFFELEPSSPSTRADPFTL